MSTVEQLNAILSQEDRQLEKIIAEQLNIRKAVTSRCWEDLELYMQKLNVLSTDFVLLEDAREQLEKELSMEVSETPLTCDKDLLRTVKSKLLQSRIENESLHKYITITQNFLQGIFDNVIPNRRNTLYSRNGQIVRNTPDALVLNTLS